MLDKYKEAFEDIEVPQELVQATAQRMIQLQQQQKQQQQKQQQQQQQQLQQGEQPRSRQPLMFRRFMPLAAACLGVLLVSTIALVALFANQDFILTPLEDGLHIERVELADGDLIFLSENRGVARPPLLARPDADAGEQGFSEERLEFDDGGVLYVTRMANSLPPNADPSREVNSEIYGIPLTVGVYDGFGIYWAQFMLDGVGYYIESENLSQEAFIRVLYGFFE